MIGGAKAPGLEKISLTVTRLLRRIHGRRAQVFLMRELGNPRIETLKGFKRTLPNTIMKMVWKPLKILGDHGLH